MSYNRHQAVGAYQRWEPVAFDAPPAPDPEPEAPPEPPSLAAEDAAPNEPPLKLPTAEDIERIHEAAHKNGYDAGYEEATARGRVEALQLHTLLTELDSALKTLDQNIAEEVLSLSVEIARQMVQRSLTDTPEVIIDTVRAALLHLPQAKTLIHLHPADLALAREYLGEQLAHHDHRLVEDDTLTPGGCRVEAAGSMVDARVETRWRRIMESLGREDTAWAPED
ncbi:MAG: flagellar assembly protein FliH [Rhodocyclaceae bacterium]|nr:flagellar assembly protein FliH [Rhodocyclaceae bacterium]